MAFRGLIGRLGTGMAQAKVAMTDCARIPGFHAGQVAAALSD